MELRQRFSTGGDIRKIKIGRSARAGNVGFCFLKLVCDVPTESGDIELDAVVFETKIKDKWPEIEQLTEGSCVYVEGYFHVRKQSDDRYKNENGAVFIGRYPQLVVEKIEIL